MLSQALHINIAPRELEILNLLWQHGPSSVRELRDNIPELAYTSVLTTCVRMVDKGLLMRKRASAGDPTRSANAFIYSPRFSEAQLMLERAAPAQSAAPARPATPAEKAITSADRVSVEQLLAYL